MTSPLSKLAAIVALIVLCGVAYLGWATAFAPGAVAMAHVREQLTDPDSAKFRNVRVNKETGVACGAVNSKNKLGGYVGFQNFLVLPGGTVTIDPGAPSSTQSASEVVAGAFKQLQFLSDYKKHCAPAAGA